jgi:uncharacterized membrane protein
MSEREVKLSGHPLHPVLATLPSGIFVAATALDALSAVHVVPALAELSFWAIGIGIALGVMASLFALLDWLFVAYLGDRGVCGLDGFAGLSVASLFLASVVLRIDEQAHATSALAFAFEFVGVVVLAAKGWLGREVAAWIESGG